MPEIAADIQSIRNFKSLVKHLRFDCLRNPFRSSCYGLRTAGLLTVTLFESKIAQGAR